MLVAPDFVSSRKVLPDSMEDGLQGSVLIPLPAQSRGGLEVGAAPSIRTNVRIASSCTGKRSDSPRSRRAEPAASRPPLQRPLDHPHQPRRQRDEVPRLLGHPVGPEQPEAAPRTVRAPVLLRPVSLRARGSGESDYELALEPSLDVNPVLARALRSRGALLDPAAVARGTFTSNGFDPRGALQRLASLGEAVLDDFSLSERVVVGTFVHPGQILVDDLDNLSGTLEPNCWVDVGDDIETKIDALFCHESQLTETGEWFREFLRERAEENGRAAGLRYAEGFRRLTF